ncbi:type II secretion system protein GspD [Glaesserella parasuis]|nr:type II secretion system protein GspD [Glaesserella parasuis]MDE4021967.1 type II secretion system protein GspD [Glaesserella parasuis]
MVRKIMFSMVFFVSSLVNADVFKLEQTEIKKAIPIIYEEVLKKPYMVDPIILEMNEKISFFINDDVNKSEFFNRYFDNMNIKVYSKNGVDYLKYVEPPKPQPKKEPKPKGYSFVYKPKYRGIEYLSENLMSFLDSSSGVDKDNFKASINTKGDVLLVHADNATIQKVKNVLPQLDTKSKQVIVIGRLVEVKQTNNSNSGLQILANLLSTKLSVNFNFGEMQDNVVSLKANNVNAVFGLIDTDTNFNVVSSPILRVMDSESGNFTVGSDVPTLGGQTVQRDGSVTRDINYRSAGVIFDVKPTITSEGVKLKIKSELSDFTKTQTGVNNTPTLLKRLVDSTVYLSDGSLIVLGGLVEEKNNKSEDSIFSMVFGKSKRFEKSDIMLLLHVKIVDDVYNAIDLDNG